MHKHDMPEAETESLLSWSASYLIQIDLFEHLFTSLDPDVHRHIARDTRVRDIIPAGHEHALFSAFRAYEQETSREIQAFGVDIDPQSARYQWGTPEKNEAAVRSIEQNSPMQKCQVICYGPSNMTLWYTLEKDFLPYQARNHGIGGCTDADLIRYAPRLLYPYQPSCVIVQTGSNDLAAGLQPDSILERKQMMYAHFLENLPATHFVVCSGLPLLGRMQYWSATDRMNTLLEDMCAHHPRLVFLNATPHMLADHGESRYRGPDGRYFRPEYFRIDRIHLNKEGHDVWTALMKQALSTLPL